MYFDSTFFIFVLPAIAISLICQAMVKSAFAKYSKVAGARGLTGAQAAEEIMRRSGVTGVRVEQVAGNLTDHYDPRTRTLRLSQSVYGSASVAAVGVAAHETGHAIQHQTGYAPLVLRSTLVPVANVGSRVGPWIAIGGLLIAQLGTLSDAVFTAGIMLYSAAVLFYLVTLPVEFDASRRALALIDEYGILGQGEAAGARSVLRAAALTYVASALSSILTLLRLVAIRNRRR